MAQTPTARELMEGALRAHQAGDLPRAAELYRQFLAQRPGHPDALNNLGNALLQLGRSEEAIDACRQALAARPAYAEAHLNIGMALQKLGRLPEAIEAYRQALAVRPDFAPALNSLGTALQQNGQLAEAVATYRRAIAVIPGYRDALNNLGNTLRESGQLEGSIEVFRQALSHHPADAEVLNNLGIALDTAGQLEEAEKTYRQALAIRPDFSQAFYNLGNALQKLDKLDDAIAAFETALRIEPELAEAWINLGNALCGSGRAQEAFPHYRRGIALKPDSRMAGSLLYALHLDPAMSPRQLYEEHARWNRQYAQPLRRLIKAHHNDRSPDRRLRIGYVSPDLGNHPVGRFMAPLLSHHDYAGFEVFCYTGAVRSDPISASNRSSADVWRSTAGLADEQIAQQIRQDGIDILIDLTMHASDNRLLVFARKPAPVQVTYLAYPGSTGLETIDYRLTDPYIDPPSTRSGQAPSTGSGQAASTRSGQDPGDDRERNYSEKSFRLPHTFWCYAAPPEACEVGPLPAIANGHVTFGCLNSFSKVSGMILEAWIQLLRQTPGSRLLLHSRQGSHRQRMQDRFRAAGVDPQRLEFVGFLPTPDYFRQYQRIDIALDTFPYAGGTTTCDALWMGVPVVTLAGQTAISRGGTSILSNLGLQGLVATSVDQYISLAGQLAADLPALAALRSGMRARMLGSPLMDAATFARDVEAAYRQMWRKWCATPS
jgi:predicted O-linked N-acetylglucosamine transferase (SPINDLY family)